MYGRRRWTVEEQQALLRLCRDIDDTDGEWDWNQITNRLGVQFGIRTVVAVKVQYSTLTKTGTALDTADVEAAVGGGGGGAAAATTDPTADIPWVQATPLS